jgi:uncharacterized protein with HEPN domain
VTAERDYRDFLNDMVLACHSISRFVDWMSPDDYLADEKTRYAVMRVHERRGSPTSVRTDEDGQCGHSLGDDGRCAQLNRKGYFGIDYSVLFTTFDQDLKPLLPRLEALAREHGVGQ